MSLLVLIPARNEGSNIGPLVRSARKHLSPDVLVVVNPSCDHTVQEAIEAAAEVIENKADLNIGGSLLEGYAYALQHGFDYVLQLDAGGSHQVSDAIDLWEFAQSKPEAAVVIGSRLMSKSRFRQRWQRRVLTYTAAYLGWAACGQGPNDFTSGLRVYSSKVLAQLVKPPFQERGHSFNWACAVYLAQQRFTLAWSPMSYSATSTSASYRSLWECFLAVVTAVDRGRAS